MIFEGRFREKFRRMAMTHRICQAASLFPRQPVRMNRSPSILLKLQEKIMWSKPQYTEMRFGFEVTMYIANR